MKIVFAVLAIVLVASGLPIVASAQSGGGCPSTGAKVVESKPVNIPESPKITNPYFGVDVDLGSDGHVRDMHIVESSGDKVSDALLRDAVKTWTFAPTREKCVAASGVVRTGVRLREDAPVEHDIVPPPTTDACIPLVDVFITPNAHDPSKRGTAHVDVPLDAAGTLAGTPKLTRNTGSATLDEEALRIARTAQYEFTRGTGCRPQPLVYNLELTFE